MKPIKTQAVLRNIALVVRSRDISNLNGTAYQFLCLMSGFIAHYDLHGFQAEYYNIDDLMIDIAESPDLSGAERYISDSFFTDKDGLYYRSKYETLVGLRDLIATYELGWSKRR